MATDLATNTPDLLTSLRQRIATPLNTTQNGAQGWAADPVYDAAVRGIQTGLAGLSSGTDLQEGRIRADAQKNAQTLADTRDKTMQSLQERLASQGIGRSSINTEESGNVLNAYTKDYENLATGETRSLEDMARDTLGKINDYNTQLGTAQAERAGRETARENAQALADATAAATKSQADEMRVTLQGLSDKLLQQLTPQPTPTGTLTVPPPPPPPLAMPPAPAVNKPTSAVAPAGPSASPEDIKRAQGVLRLAGFDPGPMDGIAGAKTIAALNRYRTSHGLPPTGTFTMDDVNALQAWVTGDMGGPTAPPSGAVNAADAPWVGGISGYIA